jgi:hypothetical protein
MIKDAMNHKNNHAHGRMLRNIAGAFVLICLISVCSVRLSADQDHEHAKQLIDTYIKAVRTDDPVLIKSSWTALNSDQEALGYMRATMPRLDYLFRIRGLYMQIQDIQAGHLEFIGGKDPSLSLNKSVSILKKDLSAQAVEDVTKFLVSEPDKTIRRTNGEIVADAQGKPLIDNREIAIGNPNQNKIDNKEYVQTRADRMFAQKFQTSPGELVPRGDSFPKTRSVD